MQDHRNHRSTACPPTLASSPTTSLKHSISMKAKNICVAWIMAMWDLICRYVTYYIYLGDCGNRSTISSLPDEVMIDVLSRLPAKSVLACRAVCSAWHRMTNTTQFTELHLIRSTPVILGRAFNRYGLFSGWFHIDNFRFTEVKVTGLKFVRQDRNSCVQASCDGLIIFQNSVGSYLICNPITREELVFSLEDCDKICGFYFHRVEKEYTLLICQRFDTNKYSLYGLSSKERRRLATTANFNLDTCGVATCGALFWCISDCNNLNSITVNTESILMFNLDTENFAMKDQPTDRYKREGRTQVKLLEIDEKLGCCDVYLKSVQVWILEDVDNWKWCKRYVVDLSGITNMDAVVYMDYPKTRVVAIQNGNLLLFRRNVGLFWWNSRLNKVSKINTKALEISSMSDQDGVSITISLVSLRECKILPVPES